MIMKKDSSLRDNDYKSTLLNQCFDNFPFHWVLHICGLMLGQSLLSNYFRNDYQNVSFMFDLRYFPPVPPTVSIQTQIKTKVLVLFLYFVFIFKRQQIFSDLKDWCNLSLLYQRLENTNKNTLQQIGKYYIHHKTLLQKFVRRLEKIVNAEKKKSR